MRRRVWTRLYLMAVCLFLVGILGQVYLAGLGVLGRQPSWDSHTDLGHSLAGATLLMIVCAYAGRLPRPIKPLTWASFVIYALLADIVIFMRDSAPKAAALHPVLAVLLFSVITVAGLRAWQFARMPEPASAATPEPSAVSPTVS